MTYRRFFPFLFALLLFTSCSKLGDIELKGIEVKGIELITTTSAIIEMEYVIQNPSNSSLILRDADGFLKRGDVNFAQITLLSADTVASKRISVNRLRFRMDILDPLSLLSMGLNLSKWKFSDFVVDARAVVKPTGRRRKVIKLRNVPMDKLVDRL